MRSLSTAGHRSRLCVGVDFGVTRVCGCVRKKHCLARAYGSHHHHATGPLTCHVHRHTHAGSGGVPASGDSRGCIRAGPPLDTAHRGCRYSGIPGAHNGTSMLLQRRTDCCGRGPDPGSLRPVNTSIHSCFFFLSCHVGYPRYGTDITPPLVPVSIDDAPCGYRSPAAAPCGTGSAGGGNPSHIRRVRSAGHERPCRGWCVPSVVCPAA